MIDHLSATGSPIQQRTAIEQETRVNPIKADEKIDSTNSNNNKKQMYQNEQKKKEAVEEVIESLNDFLKPSHTSIKFKLHEKLHEYYITVVDDNTNEVVKEIPAKKLLDTYAAMAEHLGLLFDRKI